MDFQTTSKSQAQVVSVFQVILNLGYQAASIIVYDYKEQGFSQDLETGFLKFAIFLNIFGHPIFQGRYLYPYLYGYWQKSIRIIIASACVTVYTVLR